MRKSFAPRGVAKPTNRQYTGEAQGEERARGRIVRGPGTHFFRPK
jgi:hypothetical protein